MLFRNVFRGRGVLEQTRARGESLEREKRRGGSAKGGLGYVRIACTDRSSYGFVRQASDIGGYSIEWGGVHGKKAEPLLLAVWQMSYWVTSPSVRPMVLCKVVAAVVTAGVGILIAGMGNLYTGVSKTRKGSEQLI